MTREEIDAIERANGDGAVIPAPVAPAPETYALDEDVLALLANYTQQAAAVEGAKQGAIALFMRQRGLQGNWRIADNGRELVRQS